MQIILVQTEINEAIHKYITDRVTINADMRIDIDLKATRGSEGYQAFVNVVHQDSDRSQPNETDVYSDMAAFQAQQNQSNNDKSGPSNYDEGTEVIQAHGAQLGNAPTTGNVKPATLPVTEKSEASTAGTATSGSTPSISSTATAIVSPSDAPAPKRRGRPPGSTNKPKIVFPTAQATETAEAQPAANEPAQTDGERVQPETVVEPTEVAETAAESQIRQGGGLFSSTNKPQAEDLHDEPRVNPEDPIEPDVQKPELSEPVEEEAPVPTGPSRSLFANLKRVTNP